MCDTAVKNSSGMTNQSVSVSLAFFLEQTRCRLLLFQHEPTVVD